MNKLRIKVVGIDEAPLAAFSFQPARVVSMLDMDVEERDPGKFAKIQNISNIVGKNNHRIWHFEDQDDDTRPDAPKLQTTREILEWATNGVGPNDRFLVHCHGGIGRSPSMSLGLMLLDGFEIDDAVKVLFASRVDHFSKMTMMWPNRAILRHIEFLLHIKASALELASEKWKLEALISTEEAEAILAKPRQSRKLRPAEPPIVSTVTEEMWKTASERTK